MATLARLGRRFAVLLAAAAPSLAFGEVRPPRLRLPALRPLDLTTPTEAIKRSLEKEEDPAHPQDFFHKYVVDLPRWIKPGINLELTVPGGLTFPDGPIDRIPTYLIGLSWHF
jgi:hypothetical protein